MYTTNEDRLELHYVLFIYIWERDGQILTDTKGGSILIVKYVVGTCLYVCSGEKEGVGTQCPLMVYVMLV